jgi:hypothetical protein
MNRFIALAALMTGCVDSTAVVCEDGLICPPDAMCDSRHHGCIVQSQLDSCNGIADGTTCTISVADDGACDSGVCLPAICGDAYRTGGEACDGSAFGSISNCKQLGYYDDVALGCTNKCELDDSVCTGFCGDGAVNGQELCDGALPTKSCVDFGYGAGLLQCSSNCGAALQSCVPFGWRRIDMPHNVRASHALASDNVWVVGDGTMVQHYDGSTWSNVDVSTCTAGNVYQVFALSSSDAVLMTDEGVAVVTGASCATYATTETINVLWASSPTDVYFGADTGLWHLASGSWQQVDALPTQSIWGSAANDVYASSGDPSNSSVQAVLRHYDGTWSSPAPITGLQMIFQISGTSASDVYAAGANASGLPVVMHKTTSTWTDVLGPVPFFGTSAVAVGVTKAGSRVFVTGLDLSILRGGMVSGRGDGWVNMAMPPDGTIPSGTPDGSVWVAAPQTNHVYVLDGAGLIETPALPRPPFHFAVQREDTAFALVTLMFFGNPSLFTWDGSTWTLEQSDVFAVHVAGANVFANFGGQVQMRTGPGSWTAITAMGVPSANILEGTSSSDLWYGGTSTLRYWNGSTPTVYAMPFTVYGVWAASPTQAFAVGYMGGIAQWNGSTWTQVAASPTTTSLQTIWGTSATDVYAAGAGVFLHYDGVTWSTFPVQPPESLVVSIWGTGPNDLFVVGNEGLHRWDGMRWLPVATGSDFALRGMGAIDDTLYISADDKVTQIVRTRAW